MNVKELKELLQDLPDHAEVRLMTQSNYPLEHDAAGVWIPEDEDCTTCGGEGSLVGTEEGVPGFGEKDECHVCEGTGNEHNDYTGHVYIVEGGQLGYGSEAAWEEVQ